MSISEPSWRSLRGRDAASVHGPVLALALLLFAPGTLAAQTGAEEGAGLAAELGCGACHAGLPDPAPARERAPALGAGGDPLPGRFVYDYLGDPQPRRAGLGATRMPDFRLTERERLALALAMAATVDELEEVRERHPDVDGDDGRILFGALGCAGCHGPLDPGGVSAGAPGEAVGPALAGAGARYRTEWVRAFLAEPVPVRPAGYRPGTGIRMPDFRLSPAEVETLGGFLASLEGGADADGASRRVADLPTLSPWGRSRAEVYLTDRLSCLGCHAWRDEGGRIGPPLDGVTDRLLPDEVVRMVHDPAAARPGAFMPASPFAPGILDQVAALLVTDTVGWAPAEPPELRWEERMALAEAGVERSAGERPAALLPGRRDYLTRCAQCHGVGGGGDGFNAPYLPVAPTAHRDPVAMSRRPDDTLHDGIAAGGWVLDRSHRMPAFGRVMDHHQVRSLVAYIRELCGCAPPAWSAGGGR